MLKINIKKKKKLKQQVYINIYGYVNSQKEKHGRFISHTWRGVLGSIGCSRQESMEGDTSRDLNSLGGYCIHRSEKGYIMRGKKLE